MFFGFTKIKLIQIMADKPISPLIDSCIKFLPVFVQDQRFSRYSYQFIFGFVTNWLQITTVLCWDHLEHTHDTDSQPYPNHCWLKISKYLHSDRLSKPDPNIVWGLTQQRNVSVKACGMHFQLKINICFTCCRHMSLCFHFNNHV